MKKILKNEYNYIYDNCVYIELSLSINIFHICVYVHTYSFCVCFRKIYNIRPSFRFYLPLRSYKKGIQKKLQRIRLICPGRLQSTGQRCCTKIGSKNLVHPDNRNASSQHICLRSLGICFYQGVDQFADSLGLHLRR